MAQNTNFPVSNTPFTDENGRLTKEARTLLRTLWLAGPGAPRQTGWPAATTSVNKGPVVPYSGSAVPADLATQVTFLTNLVGTLVNALASYGILED
jgi:hypothetical protein